MRLNKHFLWLLIGSLYMIFLSAIILIYNPSFLEFKNCLLLVPIYGIIIAAHFQSKNSEQDVWSIKFSLLAVTAAVVVFKVIAGLFN